MLEWGRRLHSSPGDHKRTPEQQFPGEPAQDRPLGRVMLLSDQIYLLGYFKAAAAAA